jgi:hypothetical protein
MQQRQVDEEHRPGVSVAGMRISAGRSRTLSSTISGYAKCGVMWKNASTRWLEREVGAQHAAHQLARGLHGALGPAVLLRAERRDVLGELGGRDTSSR